MANAATSENNNNSVGGKKLTELKVVELRSELEKRGLDKTGVKAVLLERLVKALDNEGKVPEDYLFAESELKSKKLPDHLSKGATVEKEMKDEEDETDEDGSLITMDECNQQNDSVDMNSSLEVENSDNKETEVENSDNKETEVENSDDKEMEVENSVNKEKEVENSVNKEKEVENSDNKEKEVENSDNKEKEVENSDNKEMEVDESNVEEKNDVEDVILNEAQQAPSPEKQITPENDTDLKETTLQVETKEISADPAALPPQSSSSSSTEVEEANTKEEDEKQNGAEDEEKQNGAEDEKQNGAEDVEQNGAEDVEPIGAEVKSETATTEEDHSAAAPPSSLDIKEEEENLDAVIDILPPTPTSVPCVAPLTLKDMINMDTSTAQQNEENESLIVHVDDTQNDLDADLFTSQANGLKSRQASKEKAIGKSEGKKSDVGSSSNPPEVGGKSGGGVVEGGVGDGGGDKGGNTEVKTEKKTDEKKDDKDGKLKSSPVSKLKIIKNLKGGNQNSRNLWICGLSTTTQATDLKGHFSKYGKVVGAKVVTNTRSPGAKCFGFLTMSSAEEASKCIQHLNQTELHGKMISVERAKNEPGTQAAKKTEAKPGEKKVEKPDVKKEAGSPHSRNLWISGLSSNTRATDLKGLFSKYGKVVGAKVVTNARSPGARCYGFLTMSTSDEASKCIQHLNQTELHGKMISVERAKNEPGTQAAKKPEIKPSEKKAEKPEVKKDDKKEDDKKESPKKEEKKEIKKDDKDKKPLIKRDDKGHRSTSSHRKIPDKSRVIVLDKCKAEPAPGLKRGGRENVDKTKTPPSGEKKIATTPKSKSKEPSESGGKDKTKKDVLSFDQIRAERERERLRQSERRLREEERRRIRELDRARVIQRDVQRRQKEEAIRLERFRERLRLEREKLEREKMERERVKLEREILERERFREEQRRAELLRIEEQQRRAMKRSYERSSTHEEGGFWSEPKRANISTPSTRFEHTYSNESRYNEYNEHRDYERRVERYERRDSRSIDTAAARFEERKDRDLSRRDIEPVRDLRDRDERRPEERSRPDDRFERREVDPGRERSNARGHETDRRDLGPERGRDTDRRSVSAHDRLGRVRNATAVPDPRVPWGSGLERKVDNWSHSHGNMDNSSVSRQNDRWMNNNMAPSHDRGPTSGGDGGAGSGSFVGSGGPGTSGMVQNMGPGNMYASTQSQPAAMMVGSGGGGGGSNMGSRMQEPRFDAYKHMRRY